MHGHMDIKSWELYGNLALKFCLLYAGYSVIAIWNINSCLKAITWYCFPSTPQIFTVLQAPKWNHSFRM